LPRYLLDTNVLSEFRRPRPSPNVLAWLAACAPGDAVTSVVVIGEILQGILLLDPSNASRAASLRIWLAGIESTSMVLPVDRPVIEVWAALRVAHPQVVDFEDMLIAATARAHGLAVATRNVSDFDRLGVPVVNPWDNSAQA
jgi:predicted nucleic acid-binding protein